MSNSTLDRKTPKAAPASKSAKTVTVRIPAKIERLFLRFDVTPEKFVNDVWSAVSTTNNLVESLHDLYPHTGKRGYICGLFIVRR